MTVATVIYYSGVHPYTLKPYKTVKDKEEKFKVENDDHFRLMVKVNRKELLASPLSDAPMRDGLI